MVAMKGKDCVVIASDHRYGIQFQTISTNFPKIHRLNSKVSLFLFVCLCLCLCLFLCLFLCFCLFLFLFLCLFVCLFIGVIWNLEEGVFGVVKRKVFLVFLVLFGI